MTGLATPADGLAAYVRVAAAEKLLAAEKYRLSMWLRDRAAEVAESTGTDPELRVKGVAHAQWTRPSRQVRVVDEAAFAGWCREAGFPVGERVEVDGSLLQLALDQDPSGPLVETLREAGFLRTVVLLSRDLLAEMESWPCRLGEVVSPDGERVPGVELVDRSAPSWRVTPDGKAVDEAKAVLRRSLTKALELPSAVAAVEPGPEAAA